MAGRNFLFVPGPTNVPDRVLRAMVVAMEDHRSSKFPELTLTLFPDLKKIFKAADGQVFIFPATGTGAWEASLTNTLSPGDKVLAPRFGQFTGNGVNETGRDHWAQCYSLLLAGGPAPGGRVLGRSDPFAAYPADDPYTPQDVNATVLHVYSDSEVIVKQMTGEYVCRSPRLYSLHWTCRKLARTFDFSISHLAREFNAEANGLANSAARKHSQYLYL